MRQFNTEATVIGTNTYSVRCARCSKWVGMDRGVLLRNKKPTGRKFFVRCQSCHTEAVKGVQK